MTIKRSVILQSQDRVLIVPSENTWRTPRGAARKRRKLNGRLHQGVRSLGKGVICSLLTLTVAQSGRTPEEAYKAMTRAWNALNAAWRLLYPRMKFFRVVELHANGFPHFHVLLVRSPYIVHEQIRTQWAGLLGQEDSYVNIKKLKGGSEHAIRYVTKYLFKQSERAEELEEARQVERKKWFARTDEEQEIFEDELSDLGKDKSNQDRFIAEASWWGKRVRPWSASKGLLAPAEKAVAWWDEVSVKEGFTSSQVARLARDRGLNVAQWDEEIGLYDLVRGPPSEVLPNAPKTEACPSCGEVAARILFGVKAWVCAGCGTVHGSARSAVHSAVHSAAVSSRVNQPKIIEQAKANRDGWHLQKTVPPPLESGLKIPSGDWVAPWVDR